ncbi:hypothetical protein H696_01725 [Fonticula alba]|uniref:Uncharacterized protein n=1 Tax=Fonticula alba TaxID=691883 RepID=A0A058ZD44_FONAL|nr:hypothetical protein H696_01725 [Fonticula alba]KCV72330.1 hypothetical protein H696_01725 [Fonticula alba]|eukprot:XP_009493908.1 hypothetical protein H696_01725 [Fonticula alba]
MRALSPGRRTRPPFSRHRRPRQKRDSLPFLPSPSSLAPPLSLSLSPRLSCRCLPFFVDSAYAVGSGERERGGGRPGALGADVCPFPRMCLSRWCACLSLPSRGEGRAACHACVCEDLPGVWEHLSSDAPSVQMHRVHAWPIHTWRGGSLSDGHSHIRRYTRWRRRACSVATAQSIVLGPQRHILHPVFSSFTPSPAPPFAGGGDGAMGEGGGSGMAAETEPPTDRGKDARREREREREIDRHTSPRAAASEERGKWGFCRPSRIFLSLPAPLSSLLPPPPCDVIPSFSLSLSLAFLLLLSLWPCLCSLSRRAAAGRKSVLMRPSVQASPFSCVAHTRSLA